MISLRFARFPSHIVPALAVALLVSSPAHAVPAYARQTGQNCIACHVSFPELTPYGRYFKLSGYTLGQRQTLPFAMMAEGSYTKIKTKNDRTGEPVDPNLGKFKLADASLFLAGKATDNAGAFVQWTYDGIEHHSSIDNADLRVVGRYIAPGSEQPDLIYGLTVHNNPTAQDVWNTTPAFGYPFTSSPVAPTPDAAALIDGALGQQAAGIGGYGFWKKSVYGELTAYRAATGPFGILRAGPVEEMTRLDGYNPYWRLAWNHEWGSHSLELGTFGMKAKVFFDPIDHGLGTNSYTDAALDAQYQFITDPHVFTAQAAYIHERQKLDASFAQGESASATNSLNTMRLKGTYYFQRRYGATLAYASTTGSTDPVLYASGRPDSSWWTLEGDYLPLQNVRLMLQYILYDKFNGAKTNYDGNGRNARDNDTLFLNLWVSF